MTSSLTSPQHLIAKVIISGLNWGIKDTEVRERERMGEGGREGERREGEKHNISNIFVYFYTV